MASQKRNVNDKPATTHTMRIGGKVRRLYPLDGATVARLGQFRDTMVTTRNSAVAKMRRAA